MENRRKLKKALGIILMIFSICFGLYVGIWLNFMHPFMEMLSLAIEQHVSLNVEAESLKIFLKLVFVLMLSGSLYFLGSILVRRK